MLGDTVMDRYDYINSIVEFVRGKTGINFQKLVGVILKEYYSYKKNTYEMPSPLGGDKKNDGWVVETGVFYQIYASSKNAESQKKDIHAKFSEDLGGLLDNVYNKGLWNGVVNEFIYIVNTFDNDLPEDSERYYEKEVKRFQTQYKISFKHRVVNVSYIFDVLCEIEDISILEKISNLLRIKSMIDYNAVSEQIMIDLIMRISSNISQKYMDELQNKANDKQYERVSSVKKISINDLDDRREKIEKIISSLDVVENAIKYINQDILFENRFDRVKTYIVDKYAELRESFHGVELYDKLIEDVISNSGYEDLNEVGAEFLVVYIFDKCDIFEKE